MITRLEFRDGDDRYLQWVNETGKFVHFWHFYGWYSESQVRARRLAVEALAEDLLKLPFFRAVRKTTMKS
jgi:hypothetical protein